MPSYCCVPGCTNRGGHLFPIQEDIQMKWRVAVNRSDPNGRDLWQPNMSNGVVCRDHFLQSDYIPGRKRKILKPDAVPSVFHFPKGKHSETGTRRKMCTNRKRYWQARQNDVGVQCTLHNSRTLFSVEKYMTDPRAVQYFTGFNGYKHFSMFFEVLRPNLDELSYQCSILPVEDQLFLTLLKLKLFLDNRMIAYFFDISDYTVSKIFTAWVNFMYSQFKKFDIWPSKKVLLDTMPTYFKTLHPSTRVIIESIEIPIEMPSSTNVRNQTLSLSKNNSTIKLLVGITPSGAVSFISDCYGGSVSDRQIIERSTLYKNADKLFERGDSIMADEHLLIMDLFTPFGIRVDTSTFLKEKTDLQKTEDFEHVAILPELAHVKGIITYAKSFKVLQGTITHNLLPLSNRIVFICFMLVNFTRKMMS